MHYNLYCSLPQSLELLSFNKGQVISKGMIPSNIKILRHSYFNQQLDSGLLPNSLTEISLDWVSKYQLELGCLPGKLKVLYLQYNQELQQGVLPQSLESLSLYDYNQPLKPNVLPSNLKSFTCDNFNNNQLSLPSSLTILNISSYTGTFVYPLPNLCSLEIHTMNQSISTLLSTVRNIKLYCYQFNFDDDLTLYDTSIERLNISYYGSDTTIAPPKFFPLSLRHLEINGLYIVSPDVINDGCISIKSSSDIDKACLPQSVITCTTR